MTDSFKARTTLKVGSRSYDIYSLGALPQDKIARLPYSLKILLENLLRFEDGVNVTRKDIEALLAWDPQAAPAHEISFTPARVLMQDFTGVPCVVDLAAMREAIVRLGGKAERVNPLAPAELVIDHSVQVDEYGTPQALAANTAIEFQRNGERYAFLRWGQKAFRDFSVVPPNTGICHQVNLEYLARVVFERELDGRRQAYPDTLVGTDSHTTMINGLGVLGWGVGGIEAEAAMLGQPITMLIPQVIGFRLSGSLQPGATATDLVLTVTEMLRKHGVVDKFVEYFGDGLANLPLADRATIGNMAPEYGSTCGIFPIDEETVRYLKLTGRAAEQIELVEAYARAQGLWRTNGAPAAAYTSVLELDLGAVEPSLAGPRRPQDRVPLRNAQSAYRSNLAKMSEERTQRDKGRTDLGRAQVTIDGRTHELRDGAVLIAAITSCTNTSNPSVMLGAGLLARNAHRAGLTAKPWVKTSLAPGSRVVTDYYKKAGLLDQLEKIGFYSVGYGCTTCIGNSGPLRSEISNAVKAGDLIGASVLSGNRNFEGRVHPEVRMNFLASPPLVVAYALAGTLDIDLATEPLGTGPDGKPVYLKDVWPDPQEVAETARRSIDSSMFRASYGSVFAGDTNWTSIRVPEGNVYAWDEHSTYVKNPPYFAGMTMTPPALADIRGARALAVLGDSVTTDHISPAGNIAKSSPAAKYLIAHGVQPADFNSYGARRGNHEVMLRGTFANIRLRNLLAPGTEGGVTIHVPSGEQMSIYDAAMRYQQEKTPLIVLAGREYGTGSSRDWAAKGTMLLGVKAVIAESFERIHRSNLIGMGVLPLQFLPGENAQSLGLTGREQFEIAGLAGLASSADKTLTVRVTPPQGEPRSIRVRVRIDTPKEQEYFRHGGILQYVLRQLAGAARAA
ncbi:MAG TPA: aconitate hydratase AcnA [Steroidobacteraceae bacterium]|nr:aconitate hydratase AcnA [Steroidobacteraceae bacterium]